MRQFILLVVISGCGGTLKEVESDEFAGKIANIWCERLKECDRSYFDATFDNHSDCVSSEESVWQEQHDYFIERDCQYTAESGATLYNMFIEMSCGELYDGTYMDNFDDIWTCG